jgi:hypothetical protein
MTYVLGDLTLPAPQSFERRFIEVARSNETLFGKTTRRLLSRKEEYRLYFTDLTQTEVNSLLNEYELNQARVFTVDEGNLAIGPIQVIVEITSRTYVPSGKEYRENLTLVLTEVSS